MFQNNVAAAIKVSGKVLRERDSTFYLPFGSEYSVLVNNLNSVRLQVKVEIDGTDATDGTSLVVAPNSSVELERFIRNGNLREGNRLKFIERTQAVEAGRGIIHSVQNAVQNLNDAGITVPGSHINRRSMRRAALRPAPTESLLCG